MKLYKNQILQLCTELGNGDAFFTGRDHTRFLLVMAGYVTFIGITMIAFFSTKYNRRLANERKEEGEEGQAGDAANDGDGASNASTKSMRRESQEGAHVSA